MESTPEILSIVKLVDNGITNFLNITNELEVGEYESVVESRLILNLCIRHLESINELAKQDLVYLPSAMVLSRSVFESAINVLWLMHPNDLFECESRYLSRLEEHEVWITNQIKYFDSLNWNSDKYAEEKRLIFEFRRSVENLLKDKGYKTSSRKNVRDILKSVNEERKYLYYKLLSGYTHGGYNSTYLYRKNLGTCKTLGEFISLDDWKLVYIVAWPAFEIASEFFIDRASKSQFKIVYPNEFKDEIRSLIDIKKTAANK
jgi:hypothetical protein